MALDYISNDTTAFSNVSLSNLSAGTITGAIAGASNFSGAAISGTSATFSGVVSLAGGTPVTRFVNTRKVVTNLTLVATKSTVTTWTDNNVAQGDIIFGSPTSNISEGIAWNFSASGASTIALRLSNVSGANASQDSSIWNYWHIKP